MAVTAMKMKTFLSSSNFVFMVCFLMSIVEGLVPLSKTFKFVNLGNLPSNGISTENNAQFLSIPHITNYPFQLCFYTSNKSKTLFTLGLSMGGGRTQSTGHEALRRWVWAANLNRPVGKNATLLFGRNGNLILADTNGRAVWQTQTANIGVTDINLLSNGNLVLLNKKGNFVWQSFDYPTNTLLNGQGLPDGSSRLVSGSYSMVVDYYPTLFFKTKRNPPMVYFSFTDFLVRFNKVNFIANGKQFDFFYAGTTGFDQYREDVWDHPGYNTTLSMLRLEKDGNLRVYTYNGFMKIWESPYSYLSSKSYECNLPEKCGLFGYCENQKCVSCPSSKGLLAASWNKECKREKTPHCKGTKSKVAYYRLENVSSSIRTANDKDYKKLSVDGCKNKCNEDCKCVGFFYRTEYGTCMVATTEMYTLTSDNIRWELGYIEPKVNTYIKYAK